MIPSDPVTQWRNEPVDLGNFLFAPSLSLKRIKEGWKYYVGTHVISKHIYKLIQSTFVVSRDFLNITSSYPKFELSGVVCYIAYSSSVLTLYILYSYRDGCFVEKTNRVFA